MPALNPSSLLCFIKSYRAALFAAISSGFFAGALKAYDNYSPRNILDENLFDAQAYSAFAFLLGLMLTFRTGQAYARFWEGVSLVHTITGSWYDAASSIASYCYFSSNDQDEVLDFLGVLIRLFSLQSALILADLEEVQAGEEKLALTYDLLDVKGLDPYTLKQIHESDAKPEFVFQTIQKFIVHHMKTGVLAIPPPVLAFAFKEMGDGMLTYHEAVKLANVPFPQPYRVAIEILLLFHFIVTPLIMVALTDTSSWAAILTGSQVFIMWALQNLASELDNPFGHDSLDLDCEFVQLEINKRLAKLIHNFNDPLVHLSARAERCSEVLVIGTQLSRKLLTEQRPLGHGHHQYIGGATKARPSDDHPELSQSLNSTKSFTRVISDASSSEAQDGSPQWSNVDLAILSRPEAAQNGAGIDVDDLRMSASAPLSDTFARKRTPDARLSKDVEGLSRKDGSQRESSSEQQHPNQNTRAIKPPIAVRPASEVKVISQPFVEHPAAEAIKAPGIQNGGGGDDANGRTPVTRRRSHSCYTDLPGSINPDNLPEPHGEPRRHSCPGADGAPKARSASVIY